MSVLTSSLKVLSNISILSIKTILDILSAHSRRSHHSLFRGQIFRLSSNQAM